MTALPPQITGWFEARGWSIHPHQRAMQERADDPCTLLIAPTGGGKTMAGFLPTLVELAAGGREGLHTLYVSPLKALAADIRRNLSAPISEMGLLIESPALNAELREALEPDFSLHNAWHVRLDDAGGMVWVSDEAVLEHQPESSFMRRIEDWFLSLLPLENEM